MRTNQKGFTLVEILIVVALSSVLMGALVPFMFNITGSSEAITDEITATLQVQNSARYICRDLKLATDTNLDDGAPAVDNLTIQWTSMYEDANVDHTVLYFVVDQELKRSYDGAITIIARNITDLEFSRSGSVVTVDITCIPDDAPDQSERGIYNVTLRQ